jgi:elongation factor G
MGELHLEIYVERMAREYGVVCISGQPRVNYKETIKSKAEFNHLHKKQTGGSGQFARVMGYMEPIDLDDKDLSAKVREDGFEFVNECVGTNIPPEFISSCEKGARDAMAKGSLTGNPMSGVRVVIQDGQAHAVDSSDLAFRICTVSEIDPPPPFTPLKKK